MSLAMLVPLVSQMLGRDVTPDVELFFRARSAVGQALTAEGRAYFVENWRSLADYMESEEGQQALQFFLEGWMGDSRATDSGSV